MIIVTLLLFLSIITSPWWVSVAIALILTLYRGGIPVLIIAGFVLDSWYGYPLQSLYGFSYVYTSIFGLLGFTAFLIRTRVIE